MHSKHKLSARLFESIVSNLKSDGNREKEKRAGVRVGVSYRTEITVVNAGGRRVTLQAQLRDISASGLGMLLNQKLQIGEQFVLELSADDGPVWIVGTITRCSTISDMSYLIGARHAKVARESSLEEIVRGLMKNAKSKSAAAPTRGGSKSDGDDQKLLDRIQRAMFDAPSEN